MNTFLKVSQLTFLFIISGCYSVKEISTYKDLVDAKINRDLQIVTNDSTVYYTENFQYTDSTITFSGKKSKDDIRTPFNGTLSFKDVGCMQTSSPNTLATLAFLTASGFLIYTGVSEISGSSGLTPNVKIVYPSGYGGDGSCPFIYVWNGNKYNLQGEVFGTSLGKALESETSIILSDIQESEAELKLKITNERPETHFFNSIKLLALETNLDKMVYADNRNSFCVISNPKEIFKARDIDGKEIVNLISKNDNVFWKSDLTSANPSQNFEDRLVIELREVEEIDSLSLVVTAINTEISSVVFKYLQNLLGDEFLNFTKAAEEDPVVIDILKKTLIRSSLKIDIWDGTNWKYIDLIYPEANSIKFSKLVRLPVIKDNYEIMKMRLRFLSDVWQIDAIKYDDSPVGDFVQFEPKLLENGTDSHDPISNIYKKDNLYTKLLPGQTINLGYELIKPSVGRKITYAVKCQGYLYEWIVDNSLVRGDMFKDLAINTPKLLFVKEMLKNLDNVLPFIYDEWKKYKKELAMKITSKM